MHTTDKMVGCVLQNLYTQTVYITFSELHLNVKINLHINNKTTRFQHYLIRLNSKHFEPQQICRSKVFNPSTPFHCTHQSAIEQSSVATLVL